MDNHIAHSGAWGIALIVVVIASRREFSTTTERRRRNFPNNKQD